MSLGVWMLQNIQGVSVLKIKTSTTCKYRQKYTHNRWYSVEIWTKI